MVTKGPSIALYTPAQVRGPSGHTGPVVAAIGRKGVPESSVPGEVSLSCQSSGAVASPVRAGCPHHLHTTTARAGACPHSPPHPTVGGRDAEASDPVTWDDVQARFPATLTPFSADLHLTATKLPVLVLVLADSDFLTLKCWVYSLTHGQAHSRPSGTTCYGHDGAANRDLACGVARRTPGAAQRHASF